MTTKTLVNFIRRPDRVSRRPRQTVEPADPNRWSASVRSWVVEFQGRDPSEPPPAFDSLFKNMEA